MRFGLCISAIALFLCACDPVKAPSAGQKDLLAPGKYPEVVFQGDLDQDLVVHEDPAVTKGTPTTQMKVRLTLRSISDDPINIKVQFIFYAADGTQLTDNPVWQERQVLPRSRVYVDASSIATNAVRWEAQIKRN